MSPHGNGHQREPGPHDYVVEREAPRKWMVTPLMMHFPTRKSAIKAARDAMQERRIWAAIWIAKDDHFRLVNPRDFET